MTTDLEVYIRCMSLMGLECTREYVDTTSNFIIIEYLGDKGTSLFTTLGYEEFYSIAKFTLLGELMKGGMTSHVAWWDDNSKELREELDKFIEEKSNE